MRRTILPKYKATTATGRAYIIDTDNNVWHTEPDSGYGGPIRKFTVGVRKGDQGEAWDWPAAQAPEVGKSLLLVTSLSNWRLSTRVETVEVLDNE